MHRESMQTSCRKTPGRYLNLGPSCWWATVQPAAPVCHVRLEKQTRSIPGDHGILQHTLIDTVDLLLHSQSWLHFIFFPYFSTHTRQVPLLHAHTQPYGKLHHKVVDQTYNFPPVLTEVSHQWTETSRFIDWRPEASAAIIAVISEWPSQ